MHHPSAWAIWQSLIVYMWWPSGVRLWCVCVMFVFEIYRDLVLRRCMRGVLFVCFDNRSYIKVDLSIAKTIIYSVNDIVIKRPHIAVVLFGHRGIRNVQASFGLLYMPVKEVRSRKGIVHTNRWKSYMSLSSRFVRCCEDLLAIRSYKSVARAMIVECMDDVEYKQPRILFMYLVWCVLKTIKKRAENCVQKQCNSVQKIEFKFVLKKKYNKSFFYFVSFYIFWCAFCICLMLFYLYFYEQLFLWQYTFFYFSVHLFLLKYIYWFIHFWMNINSLEGTLIIFSAYLFNFYVHLFDFSTHLFYLHIQSNILCILIYRRPKTNWNHTIYNSYYSAIDQRMAA